MRLKPKYLSSENNCIPGNAAHIILPSGLAIRICDMFLTEMIEYVKREGKTMFETLLNQNVCMYVMIMCGCIGLIGRAVMSSYLARLAKAAERMGTTRKKALLEIRKRYEDIASLDVDIHDTAAFVDKYIDRLKIGFVPVNVWNGFVKNMGLVVAGTGIFAAVYQYYVVGDGPEALKMCVCGLATYMLLMAAHNQWNCAWHMRALRDSVKNYLSNSLSNRLRKEEKKAEAPELQVACSSADEGMEKKRVKKKQSRNGAADYDVLLDGIMKKMLADG